MDKEIRADLPKKLYLGIVFLTVPFFIYMIYTMYLENILLAFFFGFFLFACGACFVFPATTKFSGEGVSQYSYKGAMSASWSDVTKVYSHPYGYHLHTKAGVFIIAPMLYKNGDEICRAIESKLSDTEWISK